MAYIEGYGDDGWDPEVDDLKNQVDALKAQLEKAHLVIEAAKEMRADGYGIAIGTLERFDQALADYEARGAETA